MNKGDIGKIRGLTHRPEANGRFCLIVGDAQYRPLPTANGEVLATWYPFIMAGDSSGAYIRECNVEVVLAASDPEYTVKYRAISIHATGTENAWKSATES